MAGCEQRINEFVTSAGAPGLSFALAWCLLAFNKPKSQFDPESPLG